MQVLGVDIGGSGIKSAPVDVEKGVLLSERCRIPTPQQTKPKSIAKTVAEIVKYFEWEGPIGCGFPGVVQHGITRTAANVHKKWIGTNAAELLSQATGCPVKMINDADAAGLAEMAFGAGQGRKGVVLLVTLGTGLGTSLFTDGVLLPNTELGHIEIDGKDAELIASAAVRIRENLSWKAWGKRLDTYLSRLESLIWPDLIILGGGVSKNHEKFMPYLNAKVEIVIAETFNDAGIIGAALAGTP
jgi:polyphosphate glucokinase